MKVELPNNRRKRDSNVMFTLFVGYHFMPTQKAISGRYSKNTYPMFLFSEQPPEREFVISGQALEQFRTFS